MASISFTHETAGALTLSNGKPSYGSRFANWVPMIRPVGDAAVSLATGRLTRVRVRKDYGASFEIQGIPTATVGGVRMVEVAIFLKDHLLNGGTISVATADPLVGTYPNCALMPGTEPQLRQSNRGLLEYDFSLSVINLDGFAMVIRYSSTVGT